MTRIDERDYTTEICPEGDPGSPVTMGRHAWRNVAVRAGEHPAGEPDFVQECAACGLQRIVPRPHGWTDDDFLPYDERRAS